MFSVLRGDFVMAGEYDQAANSGVEPAHHSRGRAGDVPGRKPLPWSCHDPLPSPWPPACAAQWRLQVGLPFLWAATPSKSCTVQAFMAL